MPNENKFNFVPFENEFKVEIADSEIKSVTEAAELSDENAEVLTTVFEGAVNAKVSEISEAVESHYLSQAEDMFEAKCEEYVSHISGFMEKAMNEWFEDKSESIDEAVRAEINSDLVNGLVGLLKESYFEIPADRKDLVEEMSSDIKDLEEENTQLEEKVEKLELGLKGKQCEDIVAGLSEELTDTDTEKFVSLIEDFDIDDVDVFGKKAKIIRESLFGKLEEASEEDSTTDENLDEGQKPTETPAKAVKVGYGDSLFS